MRCTECRAGCHSGGFVHVVTRSRDGRLDEHILCSDQCLSAFLERNFDRVLLQAPARFGTLRDASAA